MKAKHTATPWQTEVLGHSLRVATNDGDEFTDDIAIIGNCGVEQNQTNAAFIVNACNSHTDLIDALEQAEMDLGAIKLALPYKDGGMAQTAIERIRAALKKVGAA